ncbi:hypothetical protein [Formosa sp. A9]|uniref:hypothetical protein n=1 Tax=Formosa sp. A9 TaxID=3442641 RepID=UPI003EBC69B5
MEAKTKPSNNGIQEKTTVKKDVQKQLTNAAIGKGEAKPATPVAKTEINLDDRIQKFEKLKGLATQRERLTETLNDLTKFNYNQDGSASFQIRDSHHLEFKTTNSNLIKLVTTHLQLTLEQRKAEIESAIVAFEL